MHRHQAKPYDRVPTMEPYEEEEDDDDFIRRQIKIQKDYLEEQDQSLEQLSDSVLRLGHMSLEIGKEIETQNKMISDLDDDMDTAVTSLDIVTAKTKELIKKTGGFKWFLLIVFLVVLLLVLILLLLWT
uniref:t-SNARE coiled-coil homology domain-containing protein n=1 Tax=Octactis speculum TaxID=3111310 RepID=A0A7S2GGH2_9STRA|mmetsp:Transcript_46688/g.63576  ORF Transcript_46688/g.63576 Transcript_46688/m.63576 type:complete len:129 (+) Transcript_46688:133-519(+)